jgi:N-acetylglucosaminyldiphosphoundecaprenol N-acetyl-beta-D-mannosaminyltransferase
MLAKSTLSLSNKLFKKVQIGQIFVSNLTITNTINLFNDAIEANSKLRVCVTPVNCVVWANENQELQNLYNTADLVLCDGKPLVWISKFLGTPIKERVTGLDVLPLYLEASAKKGYTSFFLGAKEGVADYLKKVAENKYKGIQIVGTYSPPFAEKFSEDENVKIVEMINKVKPNVLWVSLTAPKQDYWIYENIDKLNVNIAIGVGGAFEVTAGLIERAPKWMQDFGLEWLFRLLKEPKRMYKRYLIEAPKIFPIIIKQKFYNKPK